MKYYCVIVVYNKLVKDSISVECIQKCNVKDLQIIIIDNSQEHYICENKSWCKKNSMSYYAMGGNVGLSKAYNFALNNILDAQPQDIIIWFDDDTKISKDYFSKLTLASNNMEYDVFVPIIYGQNGVIYSPNESGLFKGKYMKSELDLINENKFNAINSCLAVRFRVYNNYRYDESLFLDCVDTKLFDDFRARRLKFYILPVRIYQSFFQRTAEKDFDKYWNRFKIRIIDTIVYSRGNLKKRFAAVVRVLGWAIVYGIKLKSINFFCKCILLLIKEILKLNKKIESGE